MGQGRESGSDRGGKNEQTRTVGAEETSKPAEMQRKGTKRKDAMRDETDVGADDNPVLRTVG
jgi:hypothetical protein